MIDLTLGLTLGLAPPVLALHMVSVSMAKALRTYSRSRLEEVCERKGRPKRADAVAHLDERTERSAEALAVLTGLALSALLGAAAAQVSHGMTVEATVGIALALGALGHVTAGVIGRAHAETVIDALWPLALPLRTLMAPLTGFSRFAEAFAYRTARRANPSPRPASVEVEIHSVDTPSDQVEADLNDLPEATHEMLRRVVELSRMDVSEVMTPGSAIVALPASTTAKAAARTILDSGRSRIPLFGEHRDDIVGILYAKDLFAHLVDPAGPDETAPRKLARPAMFVPETKDAIELMEEFRTRRIQIAIVLDEYGGVSGLATLEDLLEQVVGPIDDEHDVPTPEDPVVPLGGTRFEVDGTLELELLNERLGLRLPTDGDFLTVGGFAFNALGRLPEAGDSFRHEGAEFTILQVADHSIRRLQVDTHPHPVVSSP